MLLSPISERRVLRRALRLDCQIVEETEFALVARRGLDLSPEGMLVESDRPMKVGQPLLVSFRMPGTRLFFDFTARVARLVGGRRPLDHGRCAGLAFDDVDATTRALLSRLLRGLPPPVPARAARFDYAASVGQIAFGA